MTNIRMHDAHSGTLGARIMFVATLTATAAALYAAEDYDIQLPAHLVQENDVNLSLNRYSESTARTNPANKSISQPSAHKEFTLRMARFAELAAEDKIVLSKNSKRDAEAFVSGLFSDNKSCDFAPFISAYDNGNLRLLWKQSGEQVGIHFLGDGNAQYVIMAKGTAKGKRTPHTGRIHFADALKLIKLLRVEHLIYA